MIHLSDDEILKALLEHGTPAAAARVLGCDRRTISARLAKPGFVEQLQAAKGKALDAAASKLSDGLCEAADTILSVLRDTDANPAVRLQAATTAFNLALRIREQQELAQRLEAVEETLNAIQLH